MNETHKLTEVKQISGSGDCLILKSDGTIEIFDYEGNGPLDEHEYEYLSGWTDIDYVIGGVRNAVGVKDDGTLMSENGLLDSFSPVKRLVKGSYGTLYITEEEKVEIIGVGEGEWLQVDGWTNVKDLAIGDKHIVALLQDGTVRAVGRNNQGQCNVEEWTDVEKYMQEAKVLLVLIKMAIYCSPELCIRGSHLRLPRNSTIYCLLQHVPDQDSVDQPART